MTQREKEKLFIENFELSEKLSIYIYIRFVPSDLRKTIGRPYVLISRIFTLVQVRWPRLRSTTVAVALLRQWHKAES